LQKEKEVLTAFHLHNKENLRPGKPAAAIKPKRGPATKRKAAIVEDDE